MFNSKNYLFLFGFGISLLFFFTFIFSCNKDNNTPAPTATVTPTPSPTPTATCSDGIKNQDETGIDCGGVCQSCSVITPCSLATNTADFPSGFQDDSYGIVNGSINVYGNYEIVANGGNSDITLETLIKPTVSGIYYTTSSTNSSSLTGNQIIISSVFGGSMSYLYYADPSQEVYINVTGSTVTYEFCTTNFNSASSPFSNLKVSGKIQVN